MCQVTYLPQRLFKLELLTKQNVHMRVMKFSVLVISIAAAFLRVEGHFIKVIKHKYKSTFLNWLRVESRAQISLGRVSQFSLLRSSYESGQYNVGI